MVWMVTRRKLLTVAALPLAWRVALATDTAWASEGAAGAFVKDLGDRALSLLATGDVSNGELRERFRRLLDEGFDIPTIGRAVLGRYWRQATAEQQTDYQAAFVDFIVVSYSIRFGAYAGETFEVLKERPLDGGDTFVMTNILRPDKPALRADFRVRSRGGDNKIVDVVVEGISMTTTQRQEFAAVVQREGVEGLIARLRDRTNELAATW